MTDSDPSGLQPSERVEQALAALLRLDVDEARRVRHETPSRRRRIPQDGPSADYA